MGTFDSKCADLAESFLDDEEWYRQRNKDDQKRLRDELASTIQDAIEAELEYFRDSLHVGMN